MNLKERYYVKCSEVKNKPGTWSSTKVEIFDKEQGDKKIGEYIRNYHGYGERTFFPFELNGKHYAVYSKDYTSTRVMTLPDCKDYCGEERDSWGFCPTEYLVPYSKHYDKYLPFGFISGCVWGDDCSWKIQLLDFSKLEEGVLRRSAEFGYIEMLGKHMLEDAIDVEDCFYEIFEEQDEEDREDPLVYVTASTAYRLKKDKDGFYKNPRKEED